MANPRIDIEIGAWDRGFGATVANMMVKAGALGKKIGGIGKGITTAAVASVAGIGVALVAGGVAAARFEDKFALVKKTMAEVKRPEVFEGIAKDLQRLSTQMPVTTTELAGVASVAGQLGVRAKDMASFVEVTGKLGVATNMTADQAATSLARFAKVTGEGTAQVGKMGAVLVQLGNNVAATETEIMTLATNFGAMGSLAGLSSEEILAFSAAMRETGQQAAAGATAMGKFFTKLSGAAKGDAKALHTFAHMTGVSVHEMSEIIEKDVTKAALMFFDSLNEMSNAGRDHTEVLQELGLNRARVARALLSLAKNEVGLQKAIKLANQEARDQNALNKEAATRFETTAQMLQQVKANTQTAAEVFGKQMLPIFKKLLTALDEVTMGFVNLAGGVGQLGDFGIKLVIIVPSVVAGLGAIKVATLALNATLKTTLSIFGSLTAAGAKAGMTSIFLHPLMLVIVAIGAGIMALWKNLRRRGRFQTAMDDLQTTVDNTTLKFQNLINAKEDMDKAFADDSFIRGIIEGMPEEVAKVATDSFNADRPAFKKAMKEAYDTGQIMTDNMVEGMIAGTALEKGARVSSEGFHAFRESLRFMQNAGGDAYGEIFTIAEDLNKELMKGRHGNEELIKQLQAELAIRINIASAGKEAVDPMEKLESLVRSTLLAQGMQGYMLEGMLDTEEELFAVAEKFKDENYEIADLLELLAKKKVPDVVDAYQQLREDLKLFKEEVNRIFAPTQMQFELEMAEFDLADSHKEHNDLHQEGKDLHQEDIDLTKELADLQSAEIMTHEEKLDQQKEINSALEIEEKIREGFAISANQQLRREKLRKERRRIQMAIEQGSIEFGDLELKNIDEQIESIEKKALTQADADEHRKKAKEIEDNAIERRAEEINKIEERRIEIEERLLELPREIKEAHYDIHKAQKDIVIKTADMRLAYIDFSTIVKDEALAMAEALGMPMSVIEGTMTLLGHLETESSKWIANKIGKQATPPVMEFFAGSGADEARGFWNQLDAPSKQKIMAKTRHQGGPVHAGRTYTVGERGPEILKQYPSGGGMVTPLGGAGQSMNNTINMNITGLPADPMTARKIAMNIQRELNKLQLDGRSGVVR